MDLSLEQKVALMGGANFAHNSSSTAMVINGVAGSGKTFTLTQMADYFASIGYGVCVVSFTNRVVGAQKSNIKQLQKRSRDRIMCSTIHSLFFEAQFDPITKELIRFEPRDEESVEEYIDKTIGVAAMNNILLVDESSMVSSALIDQITDTFPGPIIFFGDSHQLPPIGEDKSVVEDAWDINMSTIHRAAEDSGIVQLSREIRERGTYRRRNYLHCNDVEIIRKKEITKQFLKQQEFDMILCGTHKQRKKFNHLSRVARGCADQSYPKPGELITPADNISSDMARGMIFEVQDCRLVDEEVTEVKVKGFNEHFKVPLEYWSSESKYNAPKGYREFHWFTFAYAMTVHKAQGSEFDNLLVINENVSYFLNQKRFLYTAVTRAKKRLVLAEE